MLSADEAGHLDRLTLSASAPAASASSGLRHARVRGGGLEFQDYRHYQPGDDLRSIDWTVDARLRQLVVRVFSAEGRLQLHLLVDISRSMTAGVPDKLQCAKKLAAALCYIAVAHRDASGVATFDDTVRAYVGPAAGRAQIFKVFDTLRSAAAGGRSSLNKSLFDYGAAARGPGLAVVISDFFEAAGAFDGLQYLMYRGLTPAIVQVVADEELDPWLADEAELVDLEDSGGDPLVVDSSVVAAYREQLSRASGDLEQFCRSRGLAHARVVSSAPFPSLIATCRQAGLLDVHA
jgi:uncharacterized protein (DUF58 family)